MFQTYQKVNVICKNLKKFSSWRSSNLQEKILTYAEPTLKKILWYRGSALTSWGACVEEDEISLRKKHQFTNNYKPIRMKLTSLLKIQQCVSRFYTVTNFSNIRALPEDFCSMTSTVGFGFYGHDAITFKSDSRLPQNVKSNFRWQLEVNYLEETA